MEKPVLYEHLQEAALLLAQELERSRAREKQLIAGLEQVFPAYLYKRLRPDVAEAFDGDVPKLIQHFIEYGINEVDLRQEVLDNLNNVAKNTTFNCLRVLSELVDSSHKTRKGTEPRRLSLLQTKGCLSNLSGNKKHNFAISHTSILYSSNSVCTWIPKMVAQISGTLWLEQMVLLLI